MALDDEKISKAEELEGEQYFDEAPYNAMMEILMLAFGEKYTQEQIEEFVDVEMVSEILDVFYGMSGYKKKRNKRRCRLE